jgi:RHS repeat-associated protein
MTTLLKRLIFSLTVAILSLDPARAAGQLNSVTSPTDDLRASDPPAAVAAGTPARTASSAVDVTLSISLHGTGVGRVTSDSGGIDCGPDGLHCTGTFPSNTAVMLTAIAAPGSSFSGWEGCGGGTPPACLVTLDVSKTVVANFTADRQVLYYDSDAAGSTRLVTDAQGSVIETHDYTPFGVEVTPSTTLTPLLFAGKQRDRETTLDYFDARYYASRAGRFTTADPEHVGGDTFDSQSWNAYAYVRNNPLRFVDPTGTEYEVRLKNGITLYLTDQQFDRLSENPGAGISFANGEVWINNGAAKYGTYRYYYGFSDAIRDAGNSAAVRIKEKLMEMAANAATGAAFSAIGWSAEAFVVSMETKAAQMTAAAGAKRAIAGVLKQIAQGTTKGKQFNNFEGKLPVRPPGYYREYTVPLAGQAGRGAARLVKGAGGEVYFTSNHYVAFVRIR